MIDWARFHHFDQMILLFNTKQLQEPVGTHGNVVTLSESFYQEIDAHRIPVERHVVAGSAHAPGVLDFYLWIVWKSWTVKEKDAKVPLTGPGPLSRQLGTRNYTRERRFRGRIQVWLNQVRAFWPACPAEISRCSRFLLVHSLWSSAAIKSVGHCSVPRPDHLIGPQVISLSVRTIEEERRFRQIPFVLRLIWKIDLCGRKRTR